MSANCLIQKAKKGRWKGNLPRSVAVAWPLKPLNTSCMSVLTTLSQFRMTNSKCKYCFWSMPAASACRFFSIFACLESAARLLKLTIRLSISFYSKALDLGSTSANSSHNNHRNPLQHHRTINHSPFTSLAHYPTPYTVVSSGALSISSGPAMPSVLPASSS